MGINTKALRRSYEAALQDRRPDRFDSELREAFEKKEVEPKDFSIRELVEEFIPDGREVVSSWHPRNGGGGLSLSELLEADAVKTAAFSNISGQVVYNEVLGGFNNEEFVFSALIPTTSTQFNGEKIAGIGAIGDLAEVVEETHAYPMAGPQEDWIRTAETQKRGLIVPVTREAIFFDRTGQLLAEARDVGTSMGVNREKRAVDCVIDENTTSHRYNRKDLGAVATYGNNSGTHDWDNLQASNALVDWTDVDNAEQLLNSITDPNTGEPVVVGGRMMLIVAKSMERTARNVQNATLVTLSAGGFPTSGANGPPPTPNQTTFPNPVAGDFEVVSSRFVAPRLATDTDWFYGDPTIAFRYMENWPMTTVQAPTNSELEFSNDIAMRWKASERGVYATVEPRAMVECTA